MNASYHQKWDKRREIPERKNGQVKYSKNSENICYWGEMKGHQSITCRISKHVGLYQASLKEKGKMLRQMLYAKMMINGLID